MNAEQLTLALQRLDRHELSAHTTKDKRDILGVVAGVMVAMNLDLPNTPVTEIVNHYVSKCEPISMRIFDQINAGLFISTVKAAETARNIYMYRYRSVYDSELVLRLLPVLFDGRVAALPDEANKLLDRVTAELCAKAVEYCH